MSSQPKLFIGSSEKNLRVAEFLAEGLEKCADVTIWSEGVFGLNRGFFETLKDAPAKFDFAVFVLAPDDMTMSKEIEKPSPRDNVLFESGLFMGELGRDRVFFVYDESADIKIPSDLAGVTLGTYDGSRMEDEPKSAVRDVCTLISDSIKNSAFPALVGEWKSVYRKTDEEDHPLIEEVVEVTTYGDCICLASKMSTRQDDYYKAKAERHGRQLYGKWESCADSCDTSGIFMLTINPGNTFMYGYFTSHDERSGDTYVGWALAKQTGVDEAKVRERLKKAQNMLAETVGISLPDKTD
jgi:hypothetical protein